jgi:hypothetical protein
MSLENILYNPLFIMRARMRLRWRHLIGWGVVVLSFSAFIFLMFYLNSKERGLSVELAAKSCFIPLMVIQGIILMLLGTGSVASGMALERDHGTIDYQRVTPMHPANKIIGCLFGMPIREYVLFALTLPFTMLSVWLGNIPMAKVLLLYVVFFSTTWLYHLLGMVSGMLTTKPRRASWLAQAIVIMLYLFMPTLAEFGFTFLGFLTILPSAYGLIVSEVSQIHKGATSAYTMDTLHRWQDIYFFGYHIHPTVYTLLLQSALIITCFIVVYRKWHREENHVFSKTYAIIFFAGFQFFLVGGLWPFLSGIKSFKEIGKQFLRMEAVNYSLILLYLYFLLTALVVYMLIYLITPSAFDYLRGLRRKKKFAQKYIPLWRDESSSLLHSIVFVLLGSGTYAILLWLIHSNGSFWQKIPPIYAMLAAPLILAPSILAVQGFRETFGKRGFLFLLFLLWIIPGFVAVIASSAWKAINFSLYLMTVNPFAAILYSIFYLGTETSYIFNFLSIDTINSLMITSLIVQWLLAIIALTLSWRHRSTLRETEHLRNLNNTKPSLMR